jgi:hypothetical protein
VQRASTRLVATPSSDQPPPDELGVRWRRRPILAFIVRAVAVVTPLAASVAVGILASRQFRPHGWVQVSLWILWTAGASLLTLWAVDIVARRLLPLHRLLQLCLAFPDRAPSRLRVAVHAARGRRPEALADRPGPPTEAAAVAEQVVTLLAALARHDRRTRGHCERVCAFTDLLAEQMHLPQHDRDRLTWVALVHDIGKLDVPARLLNKPGRPTVSEWRLLKTHPERGAAITEPLREWLGPWADAVLEHHERYDGAGYPRGLAGAEISAAARLIAVTDAFEVMTAPRPYRRPVDAQTARAELARQAGTQFDPEVVRHFLAIGLPDLRRAMGPIAWLAQIPFISSWPRLEATASSTAGQAATATAAASAAGLLVLSGGGSTVAAAASTPPAGGLDGWVDVHPSSSDTGAQGPTAVVSTGDVHDGAAGGGRVRSHQHDAAGSAVTAASSDANGSGARSDIPTHVKGVHYRQQQPADSAPSTHGRSTADSASDGSCAGGHAYGHEHATGWQMNWGDGGRYPGQDHASDARSAGDNGDCV